MRVGVVISDIRKEEGGGYTFQDDILDALLKTAKRTRHEYILFLDKKHQLIIPDDTKNVSVVRSKRMTGVGRYKSAMYTLFKNLFVVGRALGHRSAFERSLIRNHIQIVWFMTPRFVPVDIPYVYTVWDLQHMVQPWFPEVSSKGRWHVRDQLFREALQRATVIITPNNAGKVELTRFYGISPDRIILLPHPTPSFSLGECENGVYDVQKKYSIPPRFLLYPAQFWPHKNHVSLLIAVKSIREKKNRKIPIVFTGTDCGNMGFVREVAGELELNDQVFYLGFVPRNDLIWLYRKALALAYVSYFGPENLPPLEAFALGCPVIASNVEGATEQLGDAALLIDPSSPDEIARAILRLDDSEQLREELVIKGRERAGKWAAADYVTELLERIERFEPIRRSWP